jgi:hypothetical protein
MQCDHRGDDENDRSHESLLGRTRSPFALYHNPPPTVVVPVGDGALAIAEEVTE